MPRKVVQLNLRRIPAHTNKLQAIEALQVFEEWEVLGAQEPGLWSMEEVQEVHEAGYRTFFSEGNMVDRQWGALVVVKDGWHQRVISSWATKDTVMLALDTTDGTLAISSS